MDSKEKFRFRIKTQTKFSKMSKDDTEEKYVKNTTDDNRCKHRELLLLIHPNSKFKISWDLIIIGLSVYNAILIPYQFAYNTNSSIIVQIFDRIVDLVFIIDIGINFRTGYINEQTGQLVMSTRKIAVMYVMNGRFCVDLVASLPLELFQTIFSTNDRNLKFLGMLKLVRILRLGRMISFLRSKQELKLSIKIFELTFFILLSIHWTNCALFFVAEINKEWYPPKDIDFNQTEAYIEG